MSKDTQKKEGIINPFVDENSISIDPENPNSLFKGQNPSALDKEQMRLKTSIFLTESVFAYDLFEFKYNTRIKKYEVSSLYYEGIRNFLKAKDFYKRTLENNTHVYIQEKENIIKEITSENINDVLRTYVDSIESEVKIEYLKEEYSIPNEVLRNIYLKQYHNIINNKWLTNLNNHTTPVLKDDAKTIHFAFSNGVVKVREKEGITLHKYSSMQNVCIWESHIIKHDIHSISNKDSIGHFEQFIYNVCNNDSERIDSLKSAIGYLLHNHFNPTKGQAVVFYDEELTTKEKPSGGTGKGLIVNAIKLLRSTAKIDGKNYKSDDKFKWSNINPSTQLVWIDETNKYFDFKDLFSCLTDGLQVEKKHQNKFDIDPIDSPKFVICSNTILDNRGSSNKRRQFVIELSNYYSKHIIKGSEEPIKDRHGIMFSDEWDFKEWNLFYSFMIECAHFYICHGLVNYKRINVEMNLLKQQTSSEFMEYVLNSPPPEEEPFNIKDLFDEFKQDYLGGDDSFKQRTFTNYLKKYAEAKNLEFKLHNKSGINRYHIFMNLDTRAQNPFNIGGV
jgi:hypothetical protein